MDADDWGDWTEAKSSLVIRIRNNLFQEGAVTSRDIWEAKFKTEPSSAANFAFQGVEDIWLFPMFSTPCHQYQYTKICIYIYVHTILYIYIYSQCHRPHLHFNSSHHHHHHHGQSVHLQPDMQYPCRCEHHEAVMIALKPSPKPEPVDDSWHAWLCSSLYDEQHSSLGFVFAFVS